MLAVLLPFKGGTNFTAKCNILSVNIRMLTGISMPMVELAHQTGDGDITSVLPVPNKGGLWEQ